MTAPFRGPVEDQSPFSVWLRAHPELDSVKRDISTTDCDMIFHRYKTTIDGRKDRLLQAIMLVEVKTNNALIGFAQRDTLGLINFALRLADGRIAKSDSGERFRLRSFGVHYLRMSSTAPDNSEWIKWDGKKIDVDTLVKVLHFDLHPDSLLKEPFRNHHRPRNMKTLFGGEIRRMDSR